MKGKEFEGELLTFPKGRHDDIIDSVALALPLMHPGQEPTGAAVEENSWEWWFQKAQASNMSFKGFFNQGKD